MKKKILLIKQPDALGDYYDYDGFGFGDFNGPFEPDYSINLHKIFGIPENIDMVADITIAFCDVYSDGHCCISSVFRNDGCFLGVKTPERLAPVILNFAWFFLDTSYKLENIKGYGCEIIKDCGIINTKVSNASGSGYWGEFRQLLVKDRFGGEQRMCFSVFGVFHGGYTSLVCGIEIDGHLISKLQLMFDTCLERTYGEHYILEHNGVRSRKTKQSMIDYAQSCCPELVRNGKIYLGKFDNSKNITGDSPGVHDFLARLVSYVILRKELAQIEAENR